MLFASAGLVLPWRWLDPPTTAFMLRDRLREDWAPQQRWLPLERIAPGLALCVVAAEDQKFPNHLGFDFASIQRAVDRRPGRPRGASTLTQQVAKNLYLWPGRSLVRKAIEAYLTLWIEALWPKRRILEVYLNVAEFGPSIFGAGVASERFFGKRAAELSLSEAALLAAVLPSPKRSSPAEPSDYVSERAREIEAVARKLGPGYLAAL